MKYRADFVTNSSSSSFIVTFERIPDDAEDLRQMLFGYRQEYPHPFKRGVYYPTSKVAQTVFDDMQEQIAKHGTHEPLIFTFTYSDDTEYGCALEHGILFDELPHVRESNH